MSTHPAEIRRTIDQTREDLSDQVDALANKVNPRRLASNKADRVRGRMTAIKDRIMGTASHTGEMGQAKASSGAQQVSAAGSKARQQVGAAGHQAREVFDTALHKPMERTQGSPLAAGMVAFGLGVVVSSLLPPSMREQQLAGRAKGMAMQRQDAFKQQIGGAARQVQENLREPAREAVGQVRSRAAEGASAIRDEARGTAQGLRGQAGEAREEIRQRQ